SLEDGRPAQEYGEPACDAQTASPSTVSPSIEQMCADLARDNPTSAEPNISDADLRRMWDRMRVLQELRAAKLKDNDFEGYLSTFDGHKRFAGFRAAAHRMRDPDYWRCLNLTWDNIEISYLDLDAWVALFESKRGQRYELMS